MIKCKIFQIYFYVPMCMSNIKTYKLFVDSNTFYYNSVSHFILIIEYFFMHGKFLTLILILISRKIIKIRKYTKSCGFKFITISKICS